MEDEELIERINALADEEHKLFSQEARDGVTAEERERLRVIEVTLDQCWDLLHQRRARREAGLNPDDATVRDASIVEGYIG